MVERGEKMNRQQVTREMTIAEAAARKYTADEWCRTTAEMAVSPREGRQMTRQTGHRGINGRRGPLERSTGVSPWT